MHFRTAITAAATALLAPAFAQSTPDGSAQGFSLIARITKQASDAPINVEGFYVSGVHVGAGQSAMTLIDPSSNNGVNPSIFSANGTSQEAFYHNDSILQSYPTSQYPSGIVIAESDTANSTRAAMINLGSSTRGVSLYGVSQTDDPGSQPFLGYRPNATAASGSQFIVCNEQVYGSGKVPLLFWEAPEETTTPTGCAEVKMLPQCEGDIANATAYTETSYCYKNASSAPIL